MTDDNQTNNIPVGENEKQAIENQNIFDMLGMRSLQIDEQSDYLEQLQKTIWDDFLENDVELLLTGEETEEMIEMISRNDVDDDRKQCMILEYLMDIIPDLDEIMVEKASQLKKDLAIERIISLEKLFSDDEEKQKVLRQARAAKDEERWLDLTDLLNSVQFSV